jgi:hypothetical protein
MAEKEPFAILSDDLDRHPASLAWRRIDGGKSILQVIEVLKQQEKSSVYRLRGRTPKRWTVIAKRCLMETGQLEAVIYEKILPSLSVSALHYYGCLNENGSDIWLFLEDAGTRRFSIADESHRILAAHWLGTLHRSAQHIKAAQLMPERGPAYYLELMQKGRECIAQSLANPVMRQADLGLLQRLLRLLDALESDWPKLLKVCQDIPQTLAHGDFQPRNIHVKQEPTGTALYVMDWEMAGWGIPLVDIAPSRGFSIDVQVDLPIYLPIVQEFWRGLDMPTLQYYVHVGSIFRRLAAIYWSSLGLSYRWIEEPIQSIDIYYKELAHAMIGVFEKEFANGGRA